MGVYAYPHFECLENVPLMDHKYRLLLTVVGADELQHELFLSNQTYGKTQVIKNILRTFCDPYFLSTDSRSPTGPNAAREI